MTFARQGRASLGEGGVAQRCSRCSRSGSTVAQLESSLSCSCGCGGGWPPALCAMSIAKNGKCGKWDKAAWPRVGCQLATARAELS